LSAVICKKNIFSNLEYIEKNVIHSCTTEQVVAFVRDSYTSVENFNLILEF